MADGSPGCDELTLHVGLPKAGSSLLQKCLNAERERCAEAGVRVITRGEFDELTDRRHLRWRRNGADASGLAHALTGLAELADERRVVISHEDLLGSITSFRTGQMYPWAEQVLTELAGILRPRRMRVLLYVRRQDRFLESVYLQLIRVGESLTFEDFLAGFPGPTSLSWTDLATRLARAAEACDGELVADYFEQINHGARRFCRDFMERAGLPRPTTFGFATQRVNRGYSEPALVIARAANPVLDGEDRRLLRRFLDENFSNRTHPRPQLLDDGRRHELLAALADDNHAFHERFAGALGGSCYPATP